MQHLCPTPLENKRHKISCSSGGGKISLLQLLHLLHQHASYINLTYCDVVDVVVVVPAYAGWRYYNWLPP